MVVLLSCFFISKKIDDSAAIYEHENRVEAVAASPQEHEKNKVMGSRNLSSMSSIYDAIRDILGSSEDETETHTIEVYPRFSLVQASFVPVKVGTFLMGSPVDEKRRDLDEGQYRVTLTEDFEIGVTEVTQLQWFHIMNYNPSHFKKKTYCPHSYMEMKGVSLCSDFPVEQVSWEDVKQYLEKYNEKNDQYLYRLPTEAEWEFAARAGTSTTFSFGDNVSELVNYAWLYDNSGKQTRAVGTRHPNPLNLYDVHGNVWEWVDDWYGDYPSGPVTDPIKKNQPDWIEGVTPLRVIRGGSWRNYDHALRSADRSFSESTKAWKAVGFRLVRTPK